MCNVMTGMTEILTVDGAENLPSVVGVPLRAISPVEAIATAKRLHGWTPRVIYWFGGCGYFVPLTDNRLGE